MIIYATHVQVCVYERNDDTKANIHSYKNTCYYILVSSL